MCRPTEWIADSRIFLSAIRREVLPYGFTQLTVLSVLVEAAVDCAPESVAAPAGIDTTTVPLPVIPVTVTVYVAPLPVTAAASVPVAVDPANETSDAVKPVTGALNCTVNVIDEALVGSD